MLTLDRHRPLVVAGTGVIAVTYGLIRFGYGLHLPTFAEELAIPPGLAGGIAAGGFVGYCVAAVLAHRMIALGHPRLTLWAAGTVAALGAAAVAGAWSAASLAAGVVVAGSAAGLASPALVAAVATTVPAAAADRAQAVVNSGTGAGVVLAGLLSAVLTGQWRVLWLGFAGAALAVTWWADRRTTWPDHAAHRPGPGRARHGLSGLHPALLAAVLAGAGSAAVWTFGRQVLASSGAMAPTTTALLWSVLGGAGVLGAFSGDLVQHLGLHRSWTALAVVMAAATAALVTAPGLLPVAAIAMAAFGGSYVALSGVLIATATRVAADHAAEATAALFIALTAGQALGAAALGTLAGAFSPTVGFATAAVLLGLSVVAFAPQEGGPH